MNSIDIANGIVFQKLAISKDSFADRLISQKKIYLLQSLGTDLGYTYNWYVRGPYSPSLTTYLYANLDVLASNDFSDYELAEEARKNIESVNDLENDKRQDFSTASWYELLASLLYIYKNKKSWKTDEQEHAVCSTLVQYKPQYNMDQCRYAFNILGKTGFVKTRS